MIILKDAASISIAIDMMSERDLRRLVVALGPVPRGVKGLRCIEDIRFAAVQRLRMIETVKAQRNIWPY